MHDIRREIDANFDAVNRDCGEAFAAAIVVSGCPDRIGLPGHIVTKFLFNAG